MATKFYIWKCLFLETSILGRFYILAYPTKTFHPQNLPKKAYSVNPYLWYGFDVLHVLVPGLYQAGSPTTEVTKFDFHLYQFLFKGRARIGRYNCVQWTRKRSVLCIFFFFKIPTCWRITVLGLYAYKHHHGQKEVELLIYTQLRLINTRFQFSRWRRHWTCQRTHIQPWRCFRPSVHGDLCRLYHENESGYSQGIIHTNFF